MRNPMTPWETCPVHGTPFVDADGCPDCAAQAADPDHRTFPWRQLIAVMAIGALFGLAVAFVKGL